MKCRAVMRVLDDYLEGLLAEGESVKVEGHLESCAQCRAEAAALRRTGRALGMLAAMEQAPDLTADLHRRIEAAPSRGYRWMLLGATAAAVMCVGVILVWGQARVKRGAPRDHAVTVAIGPAPGRVEAGGRGGQQSALAGQSGGRPQGVAPTMELTQARTAGRPRVADAIHSVGRKRLRQVVAAIPQPPIVAERSPAETAPAQTPMPRPPEIGIILILGEPQPIIPRSECHLEVALPDGTRSVTSQVVERSATGESRVIQIAYESP